MSAAPQSLTPPQASPLQRRALFVLAVVVALTRLPAIAHGLFDWDEALFSLGVREYDVFHHNPHPPGYPLFIAAAKLVHLAVADEFRSLQVIVVLGAFFIFPAVYWFGRELGFGFTTAVAGALIFSFLPNVWVYGGTGFSDVPAASLLFAAMALLLRGRTERRAYLLGALVLGIAAGIRPASLEIAAIPALLATWNRVRARDYGVVAGAVAGGAAIVVASYLGAAWATGSIEAYREAIRVQTRWVREVDSWHNPGRPPLREVAKVFFLMPVAQKAQMYGLTILALFSLLAAALRRRGAPFLAVAIFVPFCITAWFNLDIEAAGRYAIPYLSAHALLAADALGVLARRRTFTQGLLAGMVTSVFVVWTLPALRLQHYSDPPPTAALEWVRRNVPPQTPVYVSDAILPQAQLFLPDRHYIWQKPEQISALSGEAWVVDLKVVTGAHNFVWPRTNPLWKVVRRRNFESSVARVSSFIRFGGGWYDEEGGGEARFRWMSSKATALLPALPGNGKLYLQLYVPIDTLPAHPDIEVAFNGVVLERFKGSKADLVRSWVVPSRHDGPNELRITTSGTVNPARLGGGSEDTRDLGLRVDVLSWTPAG